MTRFALAAVLLGAAWPAAAATDVGVPRFEALSLHGGGNVTIRHGATQKVTIVRGDAGVSSFKVEGRSLRIDACNDRCPQNYKLEVEVVSPDMNALAVRGGGRISMTAFPPQETLALSVNGGGMLDTRAVKAEHVAAAVRGGGAIRTWPTRSLAASVRGGGGIIYRGDPAVSSAVRGGGSVKAE